MSQFGEYNIETMTKVFEELDRDENGVLSVHDWRQVFRMMDVEVTDEELVEVMQLCDFENSGSTQIGQASFMSALVNATGGDATDPQVSTMIRQSIINNNNTDNTTDTDGDTMQKMLKPKYNNGIQIRIYHKGVTVDKLMQDNNMKSGLYEARFILDSIMAANNITPSDIETALDECIVLDQALEQKGRKNKQNHVPISDFFKIVGISRGTEKFKTEIQRHLDKENSGLIEYRQPLFRLYLTSSATMDEKAQFSWKVCDADDSQLIDFEELLQLLLLTHPIIMTKQDAISIFKKADFLLNHCDTDNNYQLDSKEFMIMANKFQHFMFPNAQ